jgi:hypothetical protein
LVVRFEFKVWQDAERNTGGDRFDRRRLQHDPAKILRQAARRAGAQKFESTRAKRRSAGVR